MKADRFFSVHYDIAHDPKIRRLVRVTSGNRCEEVGRFLMLLSELYKADGCIDISDVYTAQDLAEELGLQESQLFGWLSSACDCGLLSGDMLMVKKVMSNGVSEQLEYKAKKREAGRKGLEKRYAKKRQQTAQKGADNNKS